MDKITGTVKLANVNGTAQIMFKRRSDFPAIGRQSVEYVATDENKIYRYDKVAGEYVCIGTNPDGLQKQIDNIVIAGTGSGDAAAEVAQARVNANGTTFETLKARIDADINALNNNTNELKEDLDINFNEFCYDMLSGVTYTDGKFVSTGGVESTATEWSHTSMMEIQSVGLPIAINGGLATSTILCFYDADKNRISGLSKSNLTNNSVTILATEIPKNAKYVIVSFNTERKSKLKIYQFYGHEELFNNVFMPYKYAVVSDSNVHIPDFNNAQLGKLYRLQITNTVPENAPTNYPTNSKFHWLLTIPNIFNSKQVIVQYIFDVTFNLKWWREYANSSWSEWRNIPEKTNNDIVIECGTGKEYTTLRSAIAKGTELGCKVIVYPGTYDLTEEFADVLSAQSGKGCVLGNGIEVVFMPGSKVTANVPSSNAWAYTNFEPFSSSGDGSFTLDGLNIETSNTRYCVHDEHSGSGTYKHIYRNCNMKTTSDTSHTSYPQCIGGGLGEHGYIEIIGGTYESAISDENLQLPITYHNGQSPTCQSRIDIKNVYLKNKGKFRFTHYGASTLKTLVNVNNCSMGGSIIIKAETTSSTTVNIELLEFNNVVR